LGIHATQLTVLNAVALGGPAGAPMRRLTELLAMDQTTLSRNLRPLERAGLVRIEGSASDRRVRLVSLSPAGERMVAQALPLWKGAHARVVSVLGGAAAAELGQAFDTAVAAVASRE
jgi:DNA-binding MarR family transcriptional regulator